MTAAGGEQARMSGRYSPRIGPVRARLLAGIAVLAFAVGLWGSPLGAHTALLEASPGPDDVAGGTIDFVDLAFLDPVSEAVVTVSFNGQPLAGSTTVNGGEVIRYELEAPLAAPGRYQVDYEMISFDSDFTTSGFFFTYDAAAPQPPRIELPGSSLDGGGSDFPVVPTIIGVAVVLALLVVFVRQIDARRQQAAGADYGYEDGYQDAYDDAYEDDYDEAYEAYDDGYSYDDGYANDTDDREW